MNARMGPEDVQYTYNITTNNNGNRLKEIMEEYQLLAANSQFQKKKGKLLTWISPLINSPVILERFEGSSKTTRKVCK